MRADVAILGIVRIVTSFAAFLVLPALLLAQNGPAPKSDAIVKVAAKLSPEAPGAEGKQVLTLNLEIEDGWHIYANPPGNEDFVSVQTTVDLSSTKPLQAVKVQYPKGKLINDSVVGKYMVYEGKQAIKATVTRAPGDSGPLELTLKFQPCNEKQCLLPATKKLTVP